MIVLVFGHTGIPEGCFLMIVLVFGHTGIPEGCFLMIVLVFGHTEIPEGCFPWMKKTLHHKKGTGVVSVSSYLCAPFLSGCSLMVRTCFLFYVLRFAVRSGFCPRTCDLIIAWRERVCKD